MSDRTPGVYIDDDEPDVLAYSSDSSEQNSLSELDDDLRVEDEDWEIAERDFTKHYNRLKQHIAVRTGNASPATSSINKLSSVATLPPVNAPSAVKKTAGIHSKDKASEQLAALSRFSSKISKIDVPYALRGGVGVNPKGPSAHANIKGKSDRATNEQVLDPRTRLVLFKMLGRGLLDEINGCVSTGKEANVYHALPGPNFSWPSRPFFHDPKQEGQPVHLAIKIYKTSILVFKDRTRYVEGEHRFRRGTNTSNPRKMVRLWAEKELRNLKRLASAGIQCPTPIEVRENVLVMEFVGDSQGWASPRLKDATLPESLDQLTDLYLQLVLMTRRMYQRCKLVHADLSEYNVLYHNATTPPEEPDSSSSKPQLVIIDVSQSVEASHPHAWDFLRKDIKNVDDFWSKRGVSTLGLRLTFDFVTQDAASMVCNDDVAPTDEEKILKNWIQDPSSRKTTSNPHAANGDNPLPSLSRTSESIQGDEVDQNLEDAVFLKSHLPRSLAEMRDPEKAIVEQRKRMEEKESQPSAPSAEVQEHSEDDEDEGYDEDEDEQSPDDDNDAAMMKNDKAPRGHRHEDREAKKERKKAVKSENKERRKNKIPKAEKKKIIKRTKASR